MQLSSRVLFFQLWPLGGIVRKGYANYDAGFATLRKQHAFRSELRQVLEYNLAHTEHVPIPLLGLGGPSGVPLTVHASYSREEILPALGQSYIGGFMPADFREGVKWCDSIKTDALLITLEKDEKDFSPQTRYHDYAQSETLFHWESQNQTSRPPPLVFATSVTSLRAAMSCSSYAATRAPILAVPSRGYCSALRSTRSTRVASRWRSPGS